MIIAICTFISIFLILLAIRYFQEAFYIIVMKEWKINQISSPVIDHKKKLRDLKVMVVHKPQQIEVTRNNITIDNLVNQSVFVSDPTN